ncbi:MAG: hypothetical protein ABSA18_17715 [Dehalococcoidia bacterium]|jgi:lipid-A-disaccharide synthase-like uncharacterized protein
MNIGQIVGIVGLVLGLVRPSIQITKLLVRGKLKKQETDLSFWFFALLVGQLGALLVNVIYSHNTVLVVHYCLQIVMNTAISVLIWKKGGRW